MKLVTPNAQDILDLDVLWREHWGPDGHSLPSREGRVIDAIAKENDRIIGYGQVTHFAEAQLFLDPNARKREKAQATKLLMLEAIRGAESVRAQGIYAFIKNPDFSLLIQKRYDFQSVIQPGELIMRRF